MERARLLAAAERVAAVELFTPLEIAVVELNIVDDASNNTIGRPSKNAMKPHLQRQWVIPPEANPPSQPAWRTSWRSIRGHMIRIDPSSAWTTR